MSVNEINLTVSAVQPIALTVEPGQGPVPMTMEQARVIYDFPYPDMSVDEIDLTVSAVQPIALTVDPDRGPVPMTMEQVRVIYDSPYPEYTGPTTVTPQARSDVVLNTSNTLMRQDVRVFEIPYYETTNPAGGYTAIIGG